MLGINMNEYEPWIEKGMTELEYFRLRYLEVSTENDRLEKQLELAKRYFILIRLPPIEKAKTVYEYESLYERCRRDADDALREMSEMI